MNEIRSQAIVVPDDRPPDWANSIMRWAITTPVIEKMVGQGVALLVFNGRRSGTEYTIPVSYYREDDIVTVVTKRQRKWWRNFETPLAVQLRLAGVTYDGEASLLSDETEVLAFMIDYLAKRPIDAKAYGLGKDEIVEEKVKEVVPQVVVIRIKTTTA